MILLIETHIYRVDLAGLILLELYRELWGGFKKSLSKNMDYRRSKNTEIALDDDKVSDLINDNNKSKMFDISMMEYITKSFGARFGTNMSGRQGIVQDINRNTMLGLYLIKKIIIYITRRIK